MIDILSSAWLDEPTGHDGRKDADQTQLIATFGYILNLCAIGLRLADKRVYKRAQQRTTRYFRVTVWHRGLIEHRHRQRGAVALNHLGGKGNFRLHCIITASGKHTSHSLRTARVEKAENVNA